MSQAKDLSLLIGVGSVAALVLFFVAKQQAAAVVDTAGNILSGHNRLTQGTPYDNAGVVGSLGAATNTILGGLPQKIGEVSGAAQSYVVEGVKGEVRTVAQWLGF